MTEVEERRGVTGLARRGRRWWPRHLRGLRHEYWRHTELRALSFLAAVGALGYTVDDTFGPTLTDTLTDAVAVWVIGMALFDPPRRRPD